MGLASSRDVTARHAISPHIVPPSHLPGRHGGDHGN